jgi:molecular chaperone HscC
VGIDDNGLVLVGRVAKEWQVLRPERCAALFKRHMGSTHTFSLPGRKFTPVELSSLVLRSLKADAEAFFERPVERAVITVPAYFNDQQRKATVQAGQLAGLKVERIVNEPTAAALAYGFHESRDDKLLLILDLGGGTFDVSLVELFDGVIEVKASSGECFLGGEDFTRALAARALESQGLPFERTELKAPKQVARMIQLAEVAKRQLSSAELVELRVPDAQGQLTEKSPRVTVRREEFQAWTESVLSRIETPIRRVLIDGRTTRDNLHEVILVGGATRMPGVTARVTELFGRQPHCRLHPDEVVALGAAVQAGLIANHRAVEVLVATDVAPFTMGVEITKEFGGQQQDGYYLPVIQRNTTIPASRVQRVGTVHPNQTEIKVRVYQGEARRCDQNILLGEFSVRGIPPGPRGQGVDIRFTYDLNGILEVEAIVVETGQGAHSIITAHAKELSAAELQMALAAMQALKLHPRDDAPHAALLRRGERLCAELTGETRALLEGLLDGFEIALESRDAAAIGAAGDTLREFLDQFDTWQDNSDWNGP